MMETSRRPDAEAGGSPRRLHTDVLLVEDLGQQRLTARLCQAILQRENISAHLVDFRSAGDIPTIVELARQMKPRLVVCSLLFAIRLEEHLTLITALREAERGAHLTITGHLVGLAPHLFLNRCVALDSALCGEAEASIVELARSVDGGATPVAIPGVLTRAGAEAACPVGIHELDALPFPAYAEGIPFRRVRYKPDEGTGLREYGFATIEASRGCDHACSFCGASAFFRRARLGYRRKSVTRLVDEIESLYQRGARLFLLDDEQFLLPRRMAPARQEYVDALERELERRKLKIAFTLKSRADEVEPALFRQLAAMGLIRVYVGIESGAPASLACFAKRTTPEQNLDALRTLAALGIVADFHTLIIHPWSALETIADDLAFLEHAFPLLSTLLSFQEIAVYAGTPMAARLGARDSIVTRYKLADPRVQLLRQVNQLVFGPGSRHMRLYHALTEAWFDYLVTRRFAGNDRGYAASLQTIAVQANQAALAAWQEMLAFAMVEDLGDVPAVHARAGGWAWQMNQTDEVLLEQLSKL
ncbi:MAG: radical SAM protein [Anaerolineae bacterium]